jgi:type II secretory pathway component PulF
MATDVSPFALAAWARQFSTLLNAGVSLIRCLDVLGQASEEPLAAVTGQMAERVSAGEVLSKAMAEHPEVFNRLSVGLCRTGEVGGVLDETFAVWADWLERDIEFRTRLDMYYLLSQVGRWPVSREEYEAQLRAEIPQLDDQVREMTWLKLLGMMLGSGVPIIQSLHVATEEVYPETAEAWAGMFEQRVRAGQSLGDGLAQLRFSASTVQLVTIGEECGTLDRMLDRAAQLLERSLEMRLSEALAARIREQSGPR